MNQVLINARKDPNYCPYCLRCRGLVRMQKIGELHWRCHCGAEHMILTQHDNIQEQTKLLKDVVVGEITPRPPQDNITIDCKIITVKGRLLQANGQYLPAGEADEVARKCGFQWAEQLVDFLTLRNPQ